MQCITAGATETVATVGLWQQEPNIYNAIPRSVCAPASWLQYCTLS